MFIAIFVVCLFASQSLLAGSYQSLLWGALLSLPVVGILAILAARLFRRSGSSRSIASSGSGGVNDAFAINIDADAPRMARVSRVPSRNARYYAVLLLLLLINAWQFASLLSDSAIHSAAAIHENPELSPDSTHSMVYGYTSRDGILNPKGKPINYLRVEKIGNDRGQLFSLDAEFILYGSTERFFRGQYLAVLLPTGFRTSSASTFLKQGIDYEARGIVQEHREPPEASRAWLRKELDIRLNTLSPQNKAYVQSLVLGYRSEMGAGLQDLFRDSGVIHILVLSGMHLGLIYMVLRIIIPGFVPLLLKEVLAVAVMGLYLWFINPGASAWRALIMLAFWSALKWSGWKISPDRMLSLVWTVIICIKPRFMFDTGMYLSFAAIWGLMHSTAIISYIAARIAYLLPLGFYPVVYPRILNILVPSLAAQSTVTVITLLLFGSIAPQGLLALPLVLPLFYGSLIVSVLLIPALFLIPELGSALGMVLEAIIHTMSGLLFPFSRIAWTLDSWPELAKYTVAFVPLLVFGACRFRASLLSSGHVQLFFSKRN